LQLSSQAQVDTLASQLRAERVQGVVLPADPLFTTLAEDLNKMLLALRLPAVYGQRLHVERGGLISYGSNFIANWSAAARYVDRILRGAKPGELAIEQPTRFDLVINLKTARAIGIEVPRALLLRADEVIE
jgi:putative tryptophan/tyrosine transport system substrate-binding protein